MAIKESGEMYLETIYILSQSKRFVRSVDVADYMNYSRPSISRAVNLLKEQGYIQIDAEGAIELTQTGRVVAQKIFERHTVLSRIFTSLGVSPETAAEDACRIEHVISDASFQALKAAFDEKGKLG